jgi:hypothetical protein
VLVAAGPVDHRQQPLTIAAFVLPGSPRAIGGVALGLLLLGSLPAARTTLVGREAGDG